MFRVYIPIAFALLFLVWVLYRLLIARDLKKNLNSVGIGVLFTVVWGVIYWVALS